MPCSQGFWAKKDIGRLTKMCFKKIFIKFMEYLDSYYGRDYLEEIEKLKAKIKANELLLDEYTKIDKNKIAELDAEIVTLKTKLKEMTAERDELKLDLEHCELEILGIKEEVKKPDWLVGKMIYKPRRRFVSKTLDITLPFEKPQHCFDKSTILYDLMKEKGLLHIEKTYENMKKIMKLISNMITYEPDKLDNWRSCSDGLMCRFDDCEGFAMMIASALGMAGWKEDEVFLCVGWLYPKGKSIEPTNKYCHAWNITKCNGKFYILEGTDRRASPRLWKDWKDKYVCNLGMCNWKFSGVIKNGKTYL